MLTGGIDVDRGNNRPSLCEFIMSERHADQLTIAVRSPIPSEEEQYHRVAAVISQGPGFATLIEQCEIGRFRHPSSIYL